MPKLMQGEKIEAEIGEACMNFIRTLSSKGYLLNGDVFPILEREAAKYNICLEVHMHRDGATVISFGRIT